MNRRIALTTLALSIAAIGVFAQAPPQPTPVFTEKSAGNGPLDRLWFRPIGPATPSGRVDDLAVLESDPTTFYVAMATAGVYKTTNAGTTFTSVFDNEGSGSIGAIAIAADRRQPGVGRHRRGQQSPELVVGRRHLQVHGRRPRRGRTWACKNSKQIARIIVDPIDFNVVYVAALGDLWGGGGERGVYKTSDGGTTWNRVLHVDDDTGATDLVIDPLNNKTLYAATYQRRRAQWGMNGGGAGSGIWKSTDAGQTWAKIETGLPAGPKGRIGLAIYRLNPNVLYATVEHPAESGVYRTDNAGASWRKLSDTNPRPDVLQPDSHRSADRLAHLRARRVAARVRRWRADLQG